MKRKYTDAVRITRPFTVVVAPDLDDPTIWTAHLIGPELDNMTYGHSPQEALSMAYDLLSLLSDYCCEAHPEHDHCIDSALDDGTPAWECSRCTTRTAKSAFDDYVDPAAS